MLQFSLRKLLIVTGLLCVCFAIAAYVSGHLGIELYHQPDVMTNEIHFAPSTSFQLQWDDFVFVNVRGSPEFVSVGPTDEFNHWKWDYKFLYVIEPPKSPYE